MTKLNTCIVCGNHGVNANKIICLECTGEEHSLHQKDKVINKSALSYDEISKWVDLIDRVKKINDEFIGLAIQDNQDTFKAVAPIDITAIINEFNLVLKGVKSE